MTQEKWWEKADRGVQGALGFRQPVINSLLQCGFVISLYNDLLNQPQVFSCEPPFQHSRNTQFGRGNTKHRGTFASPSDLNLPQKARAKAGPKLLPSQVSLNLSFAKDSWFWLKHSCASSSAPASWHPPAEVGVPANGCQGRTRSSASAAVAEDTRASWERRTDGPGHPATEGTSFPRCLPSSLPTTSLSPCRHQRRICPDNEIRDCHFWHGADFCQNLSLGLCFPTVLNLLTYNIEASDLSKHAKVLPEAQQLILVPLQSHFKERNNMSGRCQQLTVPTRRDLTYFSMLQWLL